MTFQKKYSCRESLFFCTNDSKNEDTLRIVALEYNIKI